MENHPEVKTIPFTKSADTKNSHPNVEPITEDVSRGDVTALGLAAAEVDRDLNFITILALGFNVCNSWLGIGSSIALSLISGGTVSLLYGILISTVVYLSTAGTLAELVAVYPTAGGQYHFTSILAPERFSKSLSYACGITSVFSWIALSAAITISTAQSFIAIAVMLTGNYEPETWHYFMVFQGLALLGLIYNIFALKSTPWVHNMGFALTIVIFFVSTVTCVSRSSGSYQSNEFVWATFVNSSSWPDGICFLTGLVTPCFMYAGLDAALHLAEECSEPARTVPKAILASVLIGFVTAFCFALSLLYCIQDFDRILVQTVAMVLPETYIQATRSVACASALIIVQTVIGLFIINAAQQTSSRLTWAFARDNAIVFSRFFGNIHPTLQVPVNSLLLNYAINVVTGCIYLGSTTAFNALIGTGVLLQQVSFAFPAALVIYRRRSSNFLPKSASFRLPDWLGWAANIIVVAFASLCFVMFQLPVDLPVTRSNMNYSCAVVGTMVVVGLLNWFVHGNKHYHGPRIILGQEY